MALWIACCNKKLNKKDQILSMESREGFYRRKNKTYLGQLQDYFQFLF